MSLMAGLKSSASPASLFANGEVGVWYDPSSVANLAWRYNLLTYTQEFDNAVWSKIQSGVIANSTTAPDGTTTADTIVAIATLSQHRVDYVTTIAAGTYTFSCYVKAAGYNYVWLRIGLVPSAIVSLVDGSITSLVGGTATATNAGNGWWRVALSGSSLANSTCRINVSADSTAADFTGDGTSGIYVWGAQLQTGSTATAYQVITDVVTQTIANCPNNTLYQDSAGTTPVTAPNQPVGLMLDKSQGATLGPELVTNGTFTNGTTGWTGGFATLSVVSGSLRITATAAFAYASTAVATVVGKKYIVNTTLVADAMTGNSFFYVGTSLGQGDIANINFGSTPSTQVVVFTATTTTTYLSAAGSSAALAGEYLDWDNISCKLTAGYPAFQPTSTQRPIYGINPIVGTRNLLTYTEQFDNAVWAKVGATVSANTTVAPDGTTTADKIVEDTSTGGHVALTAITTTAAVYTYSVYAKSAGRNWLLLYNLTAGYYAYFNLSTGSIGGTVGSPVTSCVDVGNGWYRCSITQTATAASNNFAAYLGSANGVNSYTGDGTSGVYLWGAQLELGSTATAYQKVVSQYEVTQAGVQSVSYLAFDGVDDGMVTGTITPNIDKAQVFAGVRKLSDAVASNIVELSATAASNSGAVRLSTATTGAYLFTSRGTSGAAAGSSAYPAPVTNVLTGAGDIAAPLAVVKVNGGAAANQVATQGTGNYLAYPLYIGSRAGTSVFFNGRLYSLIVRFGANLTTGQITSTETWVNGETGAY